MKKNKTSKKRFRFGRMQTVIAVFLLLVIVLCIVQKNVPYKKQELLLEPSEEVSFTADNAESQSECMIFWEDDANGKSGLQLMEAVLEQMKIPYDACSGREAEKVDLQEYKTIVFSVTDLSILDETLLDIIEWVKAGGGLMVLYPPEHNGMLESVGVSLGISTMGKNYHMVEGFHFSREFMLGGDLTDYKVTDPYESSLVVELSDDCQVYLESNDEYSIPLIWSREAGEGRIVFDNLGFLEKAYRGFYAASYTLLEDVCAYPVINGSAFYIDDFPSPVPGGNSQYIERDYGMSISDFYTQIWWRDVYNLAKKYGLRYTGLVIEEYSDQVEAPFQENTDIHRYRYFGNMLLSLGGELGFHGYNHMPLCLLGFDYKGEYDAYRLWESYDDMKASLTELRRFCQELYPEEKFQVYVPPSNILSEEGRAALKEAVDIRAVASIYLPDSEGISYDQEFEVGEDGIIETPRVISGYILDDYMRLAALSELNFHYVNSHFQHPDDTLDKDRGAELGWEEMFGRLLDYTDWLYQAAPDIRNLTGTELAAAVQIYDELQVRREYSGDSLRLSFDGFQDEAWLFLRVNEGTPGEASGGTIEELLEGLYLVHATDDTVEIPIR